MSPHTFQQIPPRVEGRDFRPDIEGLRAVAVILVVLFHAGVTSMAGGYIGVDVFFVVSGYLITGLLLKERIACGSTSFINFYARRARRILPAATLTLMVTVVASYRWLGFLRAGKIAGDGQWTALFVANFHLAWQGTQYLNSFEPPSPLQHYWSLAVEEQFYLVWPAVFAAAATLWRKDRLRPKVAAVLAAITAVSFIWSMIQTPRDGNVAFFSPLTRAWELAVGAMLAVSAPTVLRISSRLGDCMSWVGLGAVIGSAFILDGRTQFPGYAAALPVLGTALIIGGGTVQPCGTAALLLGTRPFQWIGKLSYSWYLWHWPVLLIASQQAGETLPIVLSIGLALLALALSFVTFRIIENPIRHSYVLAKHPVPSLLLGACLILGSFVLCSVEILSHHTNALSQSHAGAHTVESLVLV